jgi:nitroimidazol reductase NimA-like FMN-containing flavoprotein (pyridoxamine 5'-phosphate oxidase superfamily)
MEPARLRRHEQRGKYDTESLEAVFSDTFISHVSYVDNGLPQCLPMIVLFRCVGEHQDPVIYLHGHPSSRLMEIVRKKESERAAVVGRGDGKDASGEDQDDDRMRVCITATKGQS